MSEYHRVELIEGIATCLRCAWTSTAPDSMKRGQAHQREVKLKERRGR